MLREREKQQQQEQAAALQRETAWAAGLLEPRLRVYTATALSELLGVDIGDLSRMASGERVAQLRLIGPLLDDARTALPLMEALRERVNRNCPRRLAPLREEGCTTRAAVAEAFLDWGIARGLTHEMKLTAAARAEAAEAFLCWGIARGLVADMRPILAARCGTNEEGIDLALACDREAA